MRLCLVSSEHSPWGGIAHSIRRLASLLASHHEVTVIYSGGGNGSSPVSEGHRVQEITAEPHGLIEQTAFSCEEHQRSGAVLEAIERAYEGTRGPDYIEFCDFRGHGLVTLQARRAGHPLLRGALIAVKACGSSELLCQHDGTLNQPTMRLVADLEREQFRLADRLLWPGGDTLELYRRYYSDLGLPEAVRIRRPLEIPNTPTVPKPRDPAEPLRLLYVGRLQRLKGALDLAEGCQGLPVDDWTLTMIGADTPTGPMGLSVQMTIESMWAEDPRVQIDPPLPHEQLQSRWQSYDLLLLPSRFEVWGNVGLEAMRAGLPILATPVGGPAELVDPGVTGWQTDDLGPDSIRRSLAGLLENREEIESVRSSGAIFERFLQLADPDEILASYDRLLGAVPRKPVSRSSPRPPEPLVTGLIPYHGSAAYVEEAVESLLVQTHANLEVLVVNDGSFEHDDGVLVRLAENPRVSVVTQLNHGEASARNLGVALARGDFIAMLDADNRYEPEFVERALQLLLREPDLAYVTCWLRYIAPDGSPLKEIQAYAPLGNSVLSQETDNWDGDATAVLPRSVFAELGYRYEPQSALHADWELYRRLRQDGRFGAVIPEPLTKYRVHPASLTKSHDDAQHAWAHSEELTRRAMHAVRWTAEG